MIPHCGIQLAYRPKVSAADPGCVQPGRDCLPALNRRDSLKGMSIAFIGMGANLPSKAGSPEATLIAAADRIESLGKVRLRSSLYSTSPVGFDEQPRFVNAVIALETHLTPRDLLAGLLMIEREFGRDRIAGIANGPRTLDLDILLFEDRVVNEPELVIPHPRLTERLFALVPLGEIAPQWVSAGSGRTVSQLLESLNSKVESDTNAVVLLQVDGWRSSAGEHGTCSGVD